MPSTRQRECDAGGFGRQRNAERPTLNAQHRSIGSIIPIDKDTVLTDDEQAPEIIQTLDRSQSQQAKTLMNRLVDRAAVECVLANTRQLRINKAVEHIETKVSEAVGELACRIDLSVFLWNRNMHGNRCFEDPEFLKWFEKQEPDAFFKLHLRKYVNGVDLPQRSQSSQRADKFNQESRKPGNSESSETSVNSGSPGAGAPAG